MSDVVIYHHLSVNAGDSEMLMHLFYVTSPAKHRSPSCKQTAEEKSYQSVNEGSSASARNEQIRRDGAKKEREKECREKSERIDKEKDG